MYFALPKSTFYRLNGRFKEQCTNMRFSKYTKNRNSLVRTNGLQNPFFDKGLESFDVLRFFNTAWLFVDYILLHSKATKL